MTTLHCRFRRVVFVSLTLLSVAPVFAQQVIKIGAALPVTGVGAGLGIPEKHGALLAEKMINLQCGVKGRPIKIIIEDDKGMGEFADEIAFAEFLVAEGPRPRGCADKRAASNCRANHFRETYARRIGC